MCADISDNGAIVTVCCLDVASAPRKIVQSGGSGGPVVTPSRAECSWRAISAQAHFGTLVLFTERTSCTQMAPSPVATAKQRRGAGRFRASAVCVA